MKTNKKEIIKRDKILGNPKTCKRWLVWFREVTKKTKDKTFIRKIEECCGSNSWYPLDGRLSIETINQNIKSSNAYKYKPFNATHYRIWAGSILNGEYITELKRID